MLLCSLGICLEWERKRTTGGLVGLGRRFSSLSSDFWGWSSCGLCPLALPVLLLPVTHSICTVHASCSANLLKRSLVWLTIRGVISELPISLLLLRLQLAWARQTRGELGAGGAWLSTINLLTPVKFPWVWASAGAQDEKAFMEPLKGVCGLLVLLPELCHHINHSNVQPGLAVLG